MEAVDLERLCVKASFVRITGCTRLGFPVDEILFYLQVNWPARPLSKVKTALSNSFMVSSLVLRISQPDPMGGSSPQVWIQQEYRLN